jgi:AraC family transcriptional regulator
MLYTKTLTNGNKIVIEQTTNVASIRQHEAYAMKIVFSGREECVTGSRNLNVYQDTFTVLNKGTQYLSRINSEQPVYLLSILFDPKFLGSVYNAYTNTLEQQLNDPYTINQSPTFIETIYPLHGDLKINITNLKNKLEAGLQNEMLINEYLYHCLINYYGIYQKEIIDRSEKLDFVKKGTRLEIMKRLAIAREFISNNYDRDITFDEISKACCLSGTHLLRRFKEAYGISPFNYLMRIRLSRASCLLADTNYPVRQIVGMVGFECPSSFARLFKKNFSTQPLSYRRERRVISSRSNHQYETLLNK